ncbi:hypothetical protein EF912_31350 [Streptomyces sp. WAC07061]|uniref:hypothetical protein n=1 Tax=Streptomyces sp. WAC07061 TaxID=2487410 RepID=UPI000F79CEEB|nr:hypothetical protein [Streptomyces sp. WAC07061]RSS41588.1 hypothetical protein EF912_31350 [Streptomyces sp. WAC07061]
MVWVDETGRHEGSVVAVLADGGEAPPVAALDGSTAWWDSDGTVSERAAGVKGACGCGWRASQTHPVVWGDVQATEGEDARTGPYADWEYHVTTVEGLVPRDIEQMLDALHARITELAPTQPLTALRAVARIQDTAPAVAVSVVRAAREAMVTWEAVGAALGCTRQAAHERFAHHITD